MEKLRGYAAVPLGKKPRDPASDPNYFNNTWMPWMEESLVGQTLL